MHGKGVFLSYRLKDLNNAWTETMVASVALASPHVLPRRHGIPCA